MKRYLVCKLVVTAGLLFASGCTTDVKDIEKLSYASAIGVDYKDGKYYGYIQFIDFQSVAKSSDGQKQPTKVWVGEGIGNSFEESLFELYRTAQERIYWGHMTAIVVSESTFKKGFGEIYDSLLRYYEFRRTPWVYGTKQSVKDILSAGGFFGQSPLSTILHEPQGTYSQTSLIMPIKLHRLIGQINEPGFTSCIPTLAVNKKQWHVKDKIEPKLMLDGAIFLKNEAYRSFMPLEELNGLRWIQKGTIRAGIPVPNKTEPVVQIVVDYPKTKLRLDNTGGGLHYNINIKATANIVNRTKNSLLGFQQLTLKTTEAIEQEIRKSFLAGVQRQTDIYNLEHHLYRFHYQEWKTNTAAEATLINENELGDVHIDLNIEHSNSEINSITHRRD
ncbi:Ger(x)C family spore germination protein [Cohnella sp. WQ 127256]|uniref:Ger(x)C family spore germination protein n=1 Tax=Cohnella sp. WQ 127256 TaxID=2938790 RepID=UPI002117C522|nr:Ger(x)C family spore germination protein [Cohnella sp. WQ 127256]